jgi:hypothetical protein
MLSSAATTRIAKNMHKELSEAPQSGYCDDVVQNELGEHFLRGLSELAIPPKGIVALLL